MAREGENDMEEVEEEAEKIGLKMENALNPALRRDRVQTTEKGMA